MRQFTTLRESLELGNLLEIPGVGDEAAYSTNDVAIYALTH